MVPAEQYTGINSVIMKNTVSSDIKAAINAAFKFLQKKGLAKKRTDVYNNKYKDSMSLIRERLTINCQDRNDGRG